MTFIATVIAKKGLAVIADSLVTTSKKVLYSSKFYSHIEELSKQNGDVADPKITLTQADIERLFETKPTHTKDYEEKLFEFDKYTAITTAGKASINGKKIAQVVKEIKNEIQPENLPIEDKISKFIERLEIKVKEHLETIPYIDTTCFLLSHYDPDANKSTVTKINIISTTKEISETTPDFKYTERDDNGWFKVICEGQNRLSDRILFGDIMAMHSIIPWVAKRISEDYKIELAPTYISQTLLRGNDLVKQIYEDTYMGKLAELSLQQSVDLACLLMKLEIDFQKYTEDIPSVGGVIKLGIIDEDGFRFISGKEIINSLY